MQVFNETAKSNEHYGNTMLLDSDLSVRFASEKELAAMSNSEDWIMPCGHNCCSCDSQCK